MAQLFQRCTNIDGAWGAAKKMNPATLNQVVTGTNNHITTHMLSTLMPTCLLGFYLIKKWKTEKRLNKHWKHGRKRCVWYMTWKGRRFLVVVVTFQDDACSHIQRVEFNLEWNKIIISSQHLSFSFVKVVVND